MLWMLGLLGLLVAGLAASARSGTELASNARSNAIAEAAADGGIEQAIFQLLGHKWQPDGLPHRFTIGGAALVATIEDQSDRFNPNIASPSMLVALLDAVGLDPAQATDLSRMLVDWRTVAPFSLGGGPKLDRYRLANLPYGPPDRPFKTIEEMGLVPGMSADLLSRLKPYVSVYQSGDASTTPDASMTGHIAAEAAMIGRHTALIDHTSPDTLVLIRITAAAAGGAQFTRRAVARISAHPIAGKRRWQLLTWE